MKKQSIIRERFGLNGERPKTLEEMGGLFGITRERVRQIEVKVLKKLSSDNVKNGIKKYLGIDDE